MEKFNAYAIQDPRDQESSISINEKEGAEQGGAHRHAEEKEPDLPALRPNTTDGDSGNPLQESDTESSGFKKENLIPVKNTEDKDDQEEEEDEEEEEEEEDEERDDMESEEKDKEPDSDRSTTRNQSGDEFSSPADPDDTNFEDPVRDRKTDPMTDHEPRIAGI